MRHVDFRNNFLSVSTITQALRSRFNINQIFLRGVGEKGRMMFEGKMLQHPVPYGYRMDEFLSKIVAVINPISPQEHRQCHF